MRRSLHEVGLSESRASEDRLAEFIEACLVVEDGAKITPSQLRQTYRVWSEEAGLSRKEVLSGWALSVEMEARGYRKGRSSSMRWHAGVRLLTETERHAQANADHDAHSNADVDIFGQETA